MLVVSNSLLGNRKYVRSDVSIDIVINGRILGRTTNLGLGGLYATVNEPLEDFVNYKIELKLPNKSIFINGITLRTLTLNYHVHHTAIGFKEEDITDEDKLLLEDFLEGKGNYVTRK